MYPIIVLREGIKLPDDGIYYVVAANGIFLHKDTGLVEAFVPVPAISFLPELSPWARHHFPKIPAKFLAQFVNFARDVFKRLESETIVLLYYSLTEKQYALICPEQSSVSVRVKYKRDILLPGYRQVGTIHSHPDFSAFHSRIDKDDEEEFDGLHITVGNVDEPCFSISCELAVNGSRFKLSPAALIDGLEQVDWLEPEKSVADNANYALPAPVSMVLDDSWQLILSTEAEKKKPKDNARGQRRFRFEKNSPAFSADYPKNWMDKVNREKGGKENGGFRFTGAESDENKSHRNRRHRLLSFALFGQIFTVSVQRRKDD